MARLNGPFAFNGPLGGLSFYKRKDLDGTIARAKSSFTKERIRTDPAFENTRRQESEWGGRSKAAKLLRRVLHPLEPVRVGSWQGPLTGVLTDIQHLDKDSVYGQRSVLFSRHGALLDGLCLSRRTPFEELMRSPLPYTLSKERLQAQVSLPALTPGVNFFAPSSEPYFRVVVVLGVVPDVCYTLQGYRPKGDYSGLMQQVTYSDWHPVKGSAPAITLQLQLSQAPPNDAFGLVLAVGILFGSVNQWGNLEPVKYEGSGRIVAVM